MATINASSWKQSIELKPYISALPYTEIDESSLRYTPTNWKGYGTVYDDGIKYQAEFIYYGQFKYSNQKKFLDSYVTGANLASPTLGAYSIQGIRLQVKNFLEDPSVAAAKILQGSDNITGTAYGDDINASSGNDTIAGGGGDDTIDGGDGSDKAVFQGSYSEYNFEQNAQGQLIVTDITGGRDGRDTIAGIETLVFSDKEVSVSALFQPEKPSGPSQPSTPNPTGLEINLLRTSNGAVVRTGDLLGVHYSGVLMDGDGTQFDANYDFAAFSLVPSRSLFTFTVGSGQVIQGWDQALAGRRLGEVLDLTIPAELAYGSAGAPPSIPPDAPLRFRVELVGTIPDGASKAIYPSYQELGVGRKSVAQLKMLGKKFDATKIGTGTDEAMAGGAARDLLIGLDGNDVLEGGARADVLIGGSGANRFVYSAFTDSRPKRGRQDQILGFQRSRDKIDMSALSESVVYIGKKPFSREAGEVRFAGESLQLDADGNGRADLEVLLPGVNRISASNLLF